MRWILRVLIPVTLLMASLSYAVDPAPPAGYTPWFSIPLSGETGEIVSISGPPTSFQEWHVITVMVGASGAVNSAVSEEASDPLLIIPEGTPSGIVPAAWRGKTIVKDDSWNVQFSKSTGTVLGYTVFAQTVQPPAFGCSAPGKPTLSAE